MAPPCSDIRNAGLAASSGERNGAESLAAPASTSMPERTTGVGSGDVGAFDGGDARFGAGAGDAAAAGAGDLPFVIFGDTLFALGERLTTDGGCEDTVR